MRLIYKIIGAWLGLACVCLISQPIVSAQALPKTSTIIFDSFTGTYHLSRDANGRSLLTSEEVILADFPDSGNFSGITRAIPKSYQGQNVDVKVLNVTDAAGTPVPYKTSSDETGNLVVTTGNPAITLFGLQTFRISYQTRDVVNLNTSQNEFLLNVNGRGWDQPFNQVTAIVHIPKSFSSSFTSNPACYIGYLNTTNLKCSVSSQTTPLETLVTAKALGALAAHSALVIKLDFKPATFTSKQDFWNKSRLVQAAAVSAAVILLSYSCARYINRRWS
jgi:hypothetical protein